MLYDKDSPPLPSYNSPRWHTSRAQNIRTRTTIVIGVVLLMLASLGLLRHFSSPQTDLRGLHSLDSHNPRPDSQRESTARPQAVDDTISPVDKVNTAPAIGPELPTGPLVANSTLDFGKIYVLNLETREDRHDEMALIAAASGLKLQFIAGVNSKTLDTQSLPDTYGTTEVILEPAHLACYRGHANVWRQIVEDGVETALIFEDDIDWDLNIREIVPRVKEGLGRITKDPNPFSNTPCKTLLLQINYLVDILAWDVLYLGTCYEEYYYPTKDFEPDDVDEYTVDIPSDAENVDPDIYNWVEELLENYYNDTSPRRVIVKGKNPVCTHGYAVTQRGARRLLLEMNDWMPFPVDITMIHYIDEERIKAYSVLPPLFVQWRNTQDPRKNSDIEGDGIELARNWGILRSARKNLVDWYLSP